MFEIHPVEHRTDEFRLPHFELLDRPLCNTAACHLGADNAADYLCRANGVVELPGTRIPEGEHVHGTGCALSTAIAAYLANGAELLEACQEAKRFVAELIGAPVRPGRGASAVV